MLWKAVRWLRCVARIGTPAWRSSSMIIFSFFVGICGEVRVIKTRIGIGRPSTCSSSRTSATARAA